jgi:hypothetical protein
MTKAKKSWRDALRIHPAAEAFPLLPPDELKGHADDIEANGLRQKVVIYRDADGIEWLVDGRNRLDAMESRGRLLLTPNGQLNPKYVGEIVHQMGQPPDIAALVISLNDKRRHNTLAQRRVAIANVLKTDPSKSNRQAAKAAGVDHKTVAAVRAEAEGRGEIPRIKTAKDTKGREQPIRKSVRPPPLQPAEARAALCVQDVRARVLRAMDAMPPEEVAWAARCVER